MKLVFLLCVMFSVLGCYKLSPQDQKNENSSVSNTSSAPPIINKPTPKLGDCIELNYRTLKITGQGKYSFSFAPYNVSTKTFNYEDMNTLTIVDTLANYQKIVNCPESLSAQQEKELKSASEKFMKTNKKTSYDLHSVGSCIHIQSEVYQISALKDKFYALVKSDYPKNKQTHRTHIVHLDYLKQYAAPSDCREDMYKLHKLSQK